MPIGKTEIVLQKKIVLPLLKCLNKSLIELPLMPQSSKISEQTILTIKRTLAGFLQCLMGALHSSWHM